jgi:hypothetical protein
MIHAALPLPGAALPARTGRADPPCRARGFPLLREKAVERLGPDLHFDPDGMHLR